MKYVSKLGIVGDTQRIVREYIAKKAVSGSNLIELQLFGEYTDSHSVEEMVEDFKKVRSAVPDMQVVSIHTPLGPNNRRGNVCSFRSDDKEYRGLCSAIMYAGYITEMQDTKIRVVVHADRCLAPAAARLILRSSISHIKTVMANYKDVSIVVENEPAMTGRPYGKAVSISKEYNMSEYAEIVREVIGCECNVLIDTCHAESDGHILRGLNTIPNIWSEGGDLNEVDVYESTDKKDITMFHFSFAGYPGNLKANHGAPVHLGVKEEEEFTKKWFARFKDIEKTYNRELLVVFEIYEDDYGNPLNLESSVKCVNALIS